MTNFPEKIASALMESIMAAFRTEAADLQRLADEVDAAGQDVEKIRAAIERHGNRRTQAMETIRTMLTAEVAEFNELKALLRATQGNLSVHLRKLEDAGYVKIEKSFLARKPLTRARLTPAGRRAFSDYLKAIGRLIDEAPGA